MATSHLIPLEDRASWTTALAGMPHVFGHTWENAQAMHLATGDVTWLYVWERGAARVVCPISVRGHAGAHDVVTPYGYSGFVANGPAPGFADDWYAFAAARGWVCGYIQTHPLVAGPFGPHSPGYEVPKMAYLLRLDDGEDALFGRLHRSRRVAVRKWHGGSGRVVDDLDRIEAFGAQALMDFVRRRGGGVVPVSEASWRAILRGSGTLAIAAEVDGRLLAANIMVVAAGVAEGLWLFSLPGQESLSTALIWEGTRYLRKHGAKVLNLGAGVTPGDGVEAFKRSLGGEPQPLAVLKQVYDHVAFEAVCRQEGVRASIDGHFPPYRRASR